jgi:hypothetical protein
MSQRTVSVLLLSVLLHACSTAPIAERQTESSAPDETVRRFYDWYLHARFPDPRKESEAQFRRYVTAKFLREAMAPDVDAVLFIDAQDADPTWADDFSVAKATIMGDKARTQFALKGKKVHATLRVFLKRENGAWKIDNVKRGSWKAVGS